MTLAIVCQVDQRRTIYFRFTRGNLKKNHETEKAAENKTAPTKRDRKGKERGQHTRVEGWKWALGDGGGGGGATRYARNALLLSRASREWRRIAINFLSFFFSRTHRSPSASLSPHSIRGPLSSVPFGSVLN